MIFLLSVDFFLINFFKKYSYRNTIIVSSDLDPDLRSDILSGLTWIQTVCN